MPRPCPRRDGKFAGWMVLDLLMSPQLGGGRKRKTSHDDHEHTGGRPFRSSKLRTPLPRTSAEATHRSSPLSKLALHFRGILGMVRLWLGPKPIHIKSRARGTAAVVKSFRNEARKVSVGLGKLLFVLVPEEGLEPSQGYPYRILSPARLPFHHSGT